MNGLDSIVTLHSASRLQHMITIMFALEEDLVSIRILVNAILVELVRAVNSIHASAETKQIQWFVVVMENVALSINVNATMVGGESIARSPFASVYHLITGIRALDSDNVCSLILANASLVKLESCASSQCVLQLMQQMKLCALPAASVSM